MPAGGVKAVLQQNELLSGRRRSERRPCNLPILLATAAGEMRARLCDLSADGAGFVADLLLVLKPGERLLMRHKDLGEVPLIVRWAAHPRYGAEIWTSAKHLTALLAFYDSLPPATGQDR